MFNQFRISHYMACGRPGTCPKGSSPHPPLAPGPGPWARAWPKGPGALLLYLGMALGFPKWARVFWNEFEFLGMGFLGWVGTWRIGTRIGTRMGRGWDADGTRMGRGWNADGTRMERGWYSSTRMVRGWNADSKKDNISFTFEGPIRFHLTSAPEPSSGLGIFSWTVSTISDLCLTA